MEGSNGADSQKNNWRQLYDCRVVCVRIKHTVHWQYGNVSIKLHFNCTEQWNLVDVRRPLFVCFLRHFVLLRPSSDVLEVPASPNWGHADRHLLQLLCLIQPHFKKSDYPFCYHLVANMTFSEKIKKFMYFYFLNYSFRRICTFMSSWR